MDNTEYTLVVADQYAYINSCRLSYAKRNANFDIRDSDNVGIRIIPTMFNSHNSHADHRYALGTRTSQNCPRVQYFWYRRVRRD
eukprot:6193894-Pleurochrysis_carterae.AAC.1